MYRYILAVVLATLMLVATAIPALAAPAFGAPPGAAPGGVLRSPTGTEHDQRIHETGHNNEPTQCQASFCTTTP